MPNLQRSPSGTHSVNNPVHYNSDSALNTSSSGAQDDINYFNITKRHKRSFEETDDSPTSNISEIITLFNNKFEILNNTLLTISLQNQSIQASVENMSHKHDQLLTKVTALEQENIECKNRVSQLERRIDVLENKCIATTIEIRNLPKKKGRV